MQVSVDTDCHYTESILWGKELLLNEKKRQKKIQKHPNQEASSKNDPSCRIKTAPPWALSLQHKTRKNPNQTKPKPSGKMDFHSTKLRRCPLVEKPVDHENVSAPTP